MANALHISRPLLSAPPARGLAVFDLDRTLVPGSSLARLARALGEQGMLRPLPVLRACGSQVAVNPDRVLRAVATSAHWPILDLS